MCCSRVGVGEWWREHHRGMLLCNVLVKESISRTLCDFFLGEKEVKKKIKLQQ